MDEKTKKNNALRIVATGDSMTDVFGLGMSILDRDLKAAFPEKCFEIFNQGVGGTRVGYGLWRLTNEYEHRGESFPPLVSLEPDIVLLESFAYNNATDGNNEDGLRHFREMHHRIVETINRHTNAIVVFVVTMAPDTEHFLENEPGFINTPVSIRRKMAEDRLLYLSEAEKIAKELELPVANAYRASLAASEKGASLRAFADFEGIHPNHSGQELIAKVIVETLLEEKLI